MDALRILENAIAYLFAGETQQSIDPSRADAIRLLDKKWSEVNQRVNKPF